MIFDYIFTRNGKKALNGCHGYHAKAVSLILPFWKPRKIDLTPQKFEVVRAKGS